MTELIDRQAVLEMAYDMSEIDGEHFTEPCMVVDVEDIQKLSSVNPQEPKTGHWTTEWSDIDREERHYCSECGKWEYTTSKYCPNCGFRMVGEEV